MELRPTTRKESGWTENSRFLRLRSGKSNTNIKETSSSSPDKDKHVSPVSSSSLHDDIPVIPDLDEIKDELLLNEIAEPPSVAINRSIALKELNSDLLSQSAFTSIEADFSVLTSCLQQTSLDEPDEPWHWDTLFTKVSAEIHAEQVKHVWAKSRIAADEFN